MNPRYPFPIGFSPQWRPPTEYNITDARLKNWLLDTGSLTERLQARCREFHVQLLGQRQAEISLEEIQQLNTDSPVFRPDEWLVREVVLWGDGQPWVFARSLIPQALCSDELANLGNQALGKIIFNDRRFVRQPFELCYLAQPNELLKTLELNTCEPLWGRRSVFTMNQLSMSVAELFLPQSPAYADMP